MKIHVRENSPRMSRGLRPCPHLRLEFLFWISIKMLDGPGVHALGLSGVDAVAQPGREELLSR